LLAEIGDDRTRYQSASSLQALGGTSPVLFQSGMYSKAHRRLGCIKPLRNALHQFTWQTTQSEPWARQYYERKRAEGKSHTVAVRALANVWVRIIFAMWRHHQCYQTATFEQAQQQHARKVAQGGLHCLTTTHSCVKCTVPCRFCLFPTAGLDHLVQASGTAYDLLPDGGHGFT